MKLANGKPFNLIILGDVGAGKATQSAYFAKKYKMFDFDMGRELTLLRQKDKTVDKAQQRTADKGILTPTKIVRKLLVDRIHSVPEQTGILFDGHPKMIGEAKLVKKILAATNRTKPLVIYLQIPRTETVTRIKSRQGYAQTAFAKRSDDTVQGLKNRAIYYRNQIRKVTSYFDKQYQFVCVSGLGTRSQVRARIQKAIDNYLKNYDQVH